MSRECVRKLAESKTLLSLLSYETKTLKHQDTAAHQPLVSEGVIHAPDEEPEWPEVLKPELQHKVCQQHQCPHHQELQVQEGTKQDREVKYGVT